MRPGEGSRYPVTGNINGRTPPFELKIGEHRRLGGLKHQSDVLEVRRGLGGAPGGLERTEIAFNFDLFCVKSNR
jgi:hypothetical protein